MVRSCSSVKAVSASLKSKMVACVSVSPPMIRLPHMPLTESLATVLLEKLCVTLPVDELFLNCMVVSDSPVIWYENVASVSNPKVNFAPLSTWKFSVGTVEYSVSVLITVSLACAVNAEVMIAQGSRSWMSGLCMAELKKVGKSEV